MIESQQAAHRPMGSRVWACLALLAALAICYANTYDAAWQYDDYPNIVENEKIQVTQWSWPQFRNSLSAGLAHQTVSRPLAYLSFALNHRLGGSNVLGYHLVNFTVHWLSAVFLFLFIRETLRLPRIGEGYERYGNALALAAALLWATHPIQVTAVTYVVQRMASMAGLFYIMTMFFYLKGRIASGHYGRWVYFILGGTTALCGLLTKENAVLVFYAIWLFDLLLIQKWSRRRMRNNILWALGVTVGIGLVGTLYTDPRNLFQPYEMRSFTWIERLMTQPRILFFYLLLIAFPMTSRMSLLHDVEVSRSLWMPWTTFTSAVGLVMVVGLLIWLARRHPLQAYCGIFFFLNHLIEGSIFNLELIYEHRNYIPSMLLFLPLVMGVIVGAKRVGPPGKYQWMAASVFMMISASQMHATITYNQVFSSRLALWSDVVVKYPRLSLGYLNLGKVYWEAGQFKRSADQNQTAVRLDRFNNSYQKGLAYFNLGLYAAKVQQDQKSANLFFDKARTIFEALALWKKIAKVWMQTANHQMALTVMQDAARRWGEDAELFRMMGVSCLKLKQYQKARGFARKAMAVKKNDTVSLMVEAQSYRMQGNAQFALERLNRIFSADSGSIMGILALMEIYDELERPDKTAEMIDRLMVLGPVRTVDGTSASITLELEAGQREMMPYVPDMAKIRSLMTSHTGAANK